MKQNHSDKLIYEREYLKGKRNGKGKEYNQKDELIFGGELLNEKRWKGKGKNIMEKINYMKKNIQIWKKMEL